MVENDKLSMIIQNYSNNHEKYGYSARALEMPSDRRVIRYYELIKNFTFFYNREEFFSIIDLGCGYANLVDYLDYLGCKYKYIGLDLCDSFLDYARNKYKNRENIIFDKINFFENNYNKYKYDYAVSSQTFNNLYSNECDNMELIKNSVQYAFMNCNKGVAFNFVTDKVQFKKENVAYHSVEEIVTFAYSLSNNIILDNSCMPFEATMCIIKENINGLVFDSFIEKHHKEFNNGIFVVTKKEENNDK